MTLNLDKGSYLVFPVTSGCLFTRLEPKKEAPLLTSEGKFSPSFRMTAIDIFRNFDLLLN